MKIISEKAIIVGLEKVNLDDFPDLKVLGCNCTGTDHIDKEELARRGIKLISLKGETAFLKTIPSVAELTIWFMLELLRRPHNGRCIGNQLKDKCVAILGMGRIGGQVCRRLIPFRTKIIGCDIINFCGIKKECKSLEECLKQADIFAIHIPLDKNEGFLTEKHLKMMKSTAFVINTSRSQILKEGVIEKAIRNKWIAGYGTDVVRDDEEMERLKQLQQEGFNVIITEHIAGNSKEALEATQNFIEKKVGLYLEELKNNYEKNI